MKRTGMVLAWLAGAVALGACAASDAGYDLNSPDPRERATAALHAGQTKDTSAVPLLVDRLEDPDPAVRFYAIEALRRITGEDFGYAYYQSDAERAHAVERWRNYLEQRRLTAAPALLAESNPEPGS
jgi:HEAT repeat protein